MTAIISLPPGLSGSAAQLAPDGGTAGDAAADDLGPFAAIIRGLLDQQAAGNTDPALLFGLTDSAATPNRDAIAATDSTATEGLDALLPFLDAMGLTREAIPAGDDPANTSAATEEVPLDPLAATEEIPLDPLAATEKIPLDPLAAAIAPIPAATDAADEASGPAISAAGTGVSARTLPAMEAENAARQMPNAATAPDVRPSPTKEASPGRDFASQIVAAIDNVKEQPSNAPGGIAAAVHQAMAASAPHNAHATRALPVEQPVGARGWSEEVGNRVAWMASRMESRAELVLTPPQMGRVEVSLTVNGDQASANFVSANPAVREALEAALPRLREVLAEAGIQLGQAQVGAENARQSAQQDKNGDNFTFDRSGASSASEPGSATESAERAGLKTGRGLVDVFA